MFFRPLAALKNSSKKKETVIEKDIVEVYKGCNKGYKRRQKNIRLDDEFLNLVFVGLINTNLNLS